MKTINNLLVVVIISTLMSSCFSGGSKFNEDFEDYSFEEEYQDSNVNEEANSFNYNKNNIQQDRKIAENKIKTFQIRDFKTGLISSTIPFPASWKRLENNREYTFEGPNNLKVSGTFGKNFPYGNQYGGQNVPPMSIKQIIDQFFMPTARKTHRKLIKTYELPKLAQGMHNYTSQLWKYAPSQDITKAYGVEWKDNSNMKYITIVYLTNSQSQIGSYWGFMGQYLQAQAQDFEYAKKAYIYGLENTRYNPQYIAAHNQREIQRANASNASHQSKMAVLRNQGNTIANTGNIYSEISDINHNGYMNREKMKNAGHSKSVDGIYGNTTVFNPNASGQTYKVESYDNYYYGNGQGEIISTDNSLYNPNLDPNVNNQDWTRYEIDN